MTNEVIHYDHELEQAAIGAMLIDPTALTEIRNILVADDIVHHAHVKIFTAIIDLAERGTPVDAHTLRAHLAERGQLEKVGGATYIITLMQAPVTGQSGAWYARQIVEAAQRRRVVEVAARMHLDSKAGLDSADVIDRTMTALGDIGRREGDSDLVMWRDVAPGAMDRIEESGMRDSAGRGISTGNLDLDRMIGGFGPGDLIVVAGATGMGKSVAMGGFARHAAMRLKTPTVMVSLEMDRNMLFNRYAAAACQINLDKIMSGKLDDHDWTKIARWCGDTADAPLYVIDRPDATIAKIEASLTRAVERHDAQLCIIDYIQRVPIIGRSENRQVAVGDLARRAKTIAGKLGIPVIVGAQVNRSSRDRADKMPELDDLRESAVIGHEADVVIFVHRPEYYDKESPRMGEADFIVAKNRNGPTGVVTVAAQLHYQRFVPLSNEPVN